MPCTVTVDGPCRRTLRFELDRAPLEAQVETRLADIARQAAFKGFRPGKAPLTLVRRTHGKGVADEVRQAAMSRAFAAAVQEHGLRPVGDPVLDLKALDEGQGPVTFQLEVEVAPELTLRPPEGLEVTVELLELTDALVDQELRRLRERFGKLEEAPAGAAIGPDDLLEGTVTYRVGGEQRLQRQGRAVFLRHGMVDGVRIEGAAAAFTGKRVGELVELAARLPERFDPAELAGVEATLGFEIVAHRVLVVPELDQAAFERLGVTDEAQLRERLRGALAAQRQSARDAQVDRAVEERLLADHEVPLPERLLKRTIDRKIHEVAHKLMEQQGLSADDGHHRAEERRAEIVEATTRGLRLAFLLDALARAHQLSASPEETEAQVRALAAREGADPEQAVAAARAEGWLADVREQLSGDKVRAWLRGRARVSERPLAPTAA